MKDQKEIFNLPWPPSVNHYWFLVAIKGGGRKVLGVKGREFRAEVARLVGKREAREEELKVLINVYPPDKRKRDLDNLLKAVLDSLEHADVYKDDSQIVDLHVIKRQIDKPGRIEVHISESNRTSSILSKENVQ